MRSLSFFTGFTDRRDTTGEKPKNQAIQKSSRDKSYQPLKSTRSTNKSAKMVSAFCRAQQMISGRLSSLLIG
jgi:hypothetical protein